MTIAGARTVPGAPVAGPLGAAIDFDRGAGEYCVARNEALLSTIRVIGLPRALVALSGALLAVAALWWLVHRPEATPDPAEAHVRAAIAEITEQSTAPRPTPRAAAPPDFQPRAEPAETADAAATAPPGYSITGFDGEMARAPMPPRDDPTERDGAVAAEHPWLAAPGAIGALVRQSGAANRDWTFGWVGVGPDADGDALAQRLQALGGVRWSVPATCCGRVCRATPIGWNGSRACPASWAWRRRRWS